MTTQKRIFLLATPVWFFATLAINTMGAQGTVVTELTSANGNNWCNIDYDSGTDGSSAEDDVPKYTTTSLRDSPKGQWGRVTPIADGNHPNLYYNQSEIDELRHMILVQHSPQNLVDLYNKSMKNAVAVSPQNNQSPHHNNMRAAISYMIEPTPAKADAIRTALLNFMSYFPKGLPNWFRTIGCYFCGYSTPWLFDLLMAYHPGKLSSTEVNNLKNWFAKSAENLKFDTRDSFAVSGPSDNRATWTVPVSTREAKTMSPFPNWYSRYMGPSLASALVSGNQDDVDYWADSSWPHTLLTFNGVTSTFLSDQANRYDLVMYLLAVYPSGANTDTYDREGFGYNGPKTWCTVSYYDPRLADGGSYHWAQMSGAILGAEMAYHNGMIGVFGLTDVPGTEPALLRTSKLAIQSRTQKDFRPTSLTGHPSIGHDPINWAAYRRYSDPTIEHAVSKLGRSVSFGAELPNEVWEFFGYPRRIVWTSGVVQ